MAADDASTSTAHPLRNDDDSGLGLSFFANSSFVDEEMPSRPHTSNSNNSLNLSSHETSPSIPSIASHVNGSSRRSSSSLGTGKRKAQPPKKLIIDDDATFTISHETGEAVTTPEDEQPSRTTITNTTKLRQTSTSKVPSSSDHTQQQLQAADVALQSMMESILAASGSSVATASSSAEAQTLLGLGMLPYLNAAAAAAALGGSSNSVAAGGTPKTDSLKTSGQTLTTPSSITTVSATNRPTSAFQQSTPTPPPGTTETGMSVAAAISARKRKAAALLESANGGQPSELEAKERSDLEELENFAQLFKKQRIKFGFTQGDVGVALGRRYGTDFSQTTISRFEALNLSYKNMCKLRPLLTEWLEDATEAIARGQSISEFLNAAPVEPKASSNAQAAPTTLAQIVAAAASNTPIPIQNSNGQSNPHLDVRKRRKRTNLDISQRTALDAYFQINSRPDHDRMSELADALELDRDVVRVWFCNRRQKLRKE